VKNEKDILIHVELDGNKLCAVCESNLEACKYAFRILCDGKEIDQALYTDRNHTTYWLNKSGNYAVEAYVRDEEMNMVAKKMSQEVTYEVTGGKNKKEKKSVLSSVSYTFQTILKNLPMIFRIARYDYKLLNQDSYLGKIWNILTPLIQIGTYWLVFGIGIRNGQPVDGDPYMLWMLCGLVPWFFVNEGIVKGSNAIFGKANTVTRMKFPIVTVPISAIVTCLMEHVMVIVILFVTLLYFGYYPNWYFMNVIYYLLYAVVFLSSLALVTSVLTMIARDFQKILRLLMRLLFYVTPILWTMDKMPQVYQDILGLNPVLYVVDGFRDSFIRETAFYEHPEKMVFFWSINLILLIWGCRLQDKFKSKFIDLR